MMKPTLLIIQPSHYLSKTDRRVFKTRRRSVLPLPVTRGRIASWVINWSERGMVRAALNHNDFDSL